MSDNINPHGDAWQNLMGTPTACKDICCSRFASHRDDLPQYLVADLDNEPLKIFAKDRFPEDIDYSAIEMSCRLASMLCRTGGASRYIATLHSGQILSVNADGSKGQPVNWKGLSPGANIVYSPLPRHRNDAQANDAEAALVLDNLAWMVRYVVEKLPPTIGAETIVDPDVEFDIPPDPTYKMFYARNGDGDTPGDKSVIRIAKSSYDTLVEQRKGAAGLIPAEWLLAAQVELALDLVHEVAHSLGFALHNNRPNEPFYDNNTLSEAGFDFHKAIFGGILMTSNYFTDGWRHEKLKYPHCAVSHARGEEVKTSQNKFQSYYKHYTLREWPCGTIQADYDRAGHKIGSRVGVLPATGPLTVPTVGSLAFKLNAKGELEATSHA